MAEGDGSSNTGMVAVVVILVIVLIAGFFAYQNGMFGGGRSSTDVNVDITSPKEAPKPAENPPPADQPG